MSQIIGVIMIIGTLGLNVFMLDPAVFIDLPSFLFVIGLTLGGLIATYGIPKLITVLEEKELRLEVLRSAKVYLLITSVLGPTISIVLMLHNLSDPKTLGPAMAVALLTSVYSLIFFFAICIYERKAYDDLKLFMLPLIGLVFNIGAVMLVQYSLTYNSL